eukprot:Skav205775  [mRNA]  locus=scaffold1714:602202:602981:- [translate_table: standard]
MDTFPNSFSNDRGWDAGDPGGHDGFLSFSEFSTGALLLYQDALEDELHVLFSSYDSDKKGYLTPAEAAQFLDSVRAATDLGGRPQGCGWGAVGWVGELGDLGVGGVGGLVGWVGGGLVIGIG